MDEGPIFGQNCERTNSIMKLSVYDPPMCCPTGVCGPTVDPALPRFAADLDWLRSKGIEVERFNLAQQPAAFVENPVVSQALAAKGNDCLPLVLLDHKIVSESSYPPLDKLSQLVGLGVVPVSLFTDQVAELVAIGAAIASNCEPCFRFHFDRARKLGVSREDMARAVAMAKSVKETPARSVLDLAERYLKPTGAGAEAFPAVADATRVNPGSKCC